MRKMNNKQLEKLANLPDSEIDFSDIPKIKNTQNFHRLYPKANKDTMITDQMIFESLNKIIEKEEPEKTPVTLKLDQRVISFFKGHSKKYQTKINEILLAFVLSYEKSH